MDRRNCWEVCRCGREPGGNRADTEGICPAAVAQEFDGINGGRNGGRVCWAISGTVCNGCVQGTFAEKLPSCVMCDFFRQVKLRERAEFVMHPLKRTRESHDAFSIPPPGGHPEGRMKT